MTEENKNHEHNCGDDCGCDHELPKMQLVLDDGTEVEWDVLTTFDVRDREYIALIPDDSEDVFIYRYSEDEEGVELTNIEDDDEFEEVGKTLEQILDEAFEDEEE